MVVKISLKTFKEKVRAQVTTLSTIRTGVSVADLTTFIINAYKNGNLKPSIIKSFAVTGTFPFDDNKLRELLKRERTKRIDARTPFENSVFKYLDARLTQMGLLHKKKQQQDELEGQSRKARTKISNEKALRLTNASTMAAISHAADLKEMKNMKVALLHQRMLQLGFSNEALLRPGTMKKKKKDELLEMADNHYEGLFEQSRIEFAAKFPLVNPPENAVRARMLPVAPPTVAPLPNSPTLPSPKQILASSQPSKAATASDELNRVKPPKRMARRSTQQKRAKKQKASQEIDSSPSITSIQREEGKRTVKKKKITDV